MNKDQSKQEGLSPEMTKAEVAAIRTLRRLSKRWPNTLWLASMSGTLNVMRTNQSGERVYHRITPTNWTAQGAA